VEKPGRYLRWVVKLGTGELPGQLPAAITDNTTLTTVNISVAKKTLTPPDG
jgi:hypothetical protein